MCYYFIIVCCYVLLHCVCCICICICRYPQRAIGLTGCFWPQKTGGPGPKVWVSARSLGNNAYSQKIMIHPPGIRRTLPKTGHSLCAAGPKISKRVQVKLFGPHQVNCYVPPRRENHIICCWESFIINFFINNIILSHPSKDVFAYICYNIIQK